MPMHKQFPGANMRIIPAISVLLFGSYISAAPVAVLDTNVMVYTNNFETETVGPLSEARI